MGRSVVEATYRPESLTSTSVLRPYLTVPRLIEDAATKELERFKRLHTSIDGSPMFNNTAMVTRAQPWHWGHQKSFDALNSITDPNGKVIIVLADVGKRDIDNPLPPERCEEIIREQLEAKGIPEERYIIYRMPDLNNPPLWGQTIINELRGRGVVLDAVMSFNPTVTSVFEAYEDITIIDPPDTWRGRRGGAVRDGLRKSGDLVPAEELVLSG